MFTLSQFSRDALLNMIVRFILLGMGALQSVIAARILGPRNNGYLALILLIPGFAYSLGWMGIGQSINYYSGKYSRDIVLAHGFVLTILLGAISTALAIPASYYLRDVFFAGIDLRLLLLASSSTLLNFIFYYFIVSSLAQKRIALFNLLALLQAFVSLVSLILFILVMQWGLFGAIMAWVSGLVLPIIIGLFLFAKDLKYSWHLDFQLFKQLVSFGSKSHFGNLFRKLNDRADLFIVAFFLSPENVGYYSVALLIANVVLRIPESIQDVLLPRLTQSKRSEKKFVLAVSRRVIIVVFLACIGLVGISNQLVSILFGKEYQPSVAILFFLIPGVLAHSIAKVISVDVIALGRPLLYSLSTFVSICALTFDFYLIPKYGATGAALGLSVSYIIGTGVLVIGYKRIANVALVDLLVPKISDLTFFLASATKIINNLFSKIALRGQR